MSEKVGRVLAGGAWEAGGPWHHWGGSKWLIGCQSAAGPSLLAPPPPTIPTQSSAHRPPATGPPPPAPRPHPAHCRLILEADAATVATRVTMRMDGDGSPLSMEASANVSSRTPGARAPLSSACCLFGSALLAAMPACLPACLPAWIQHRPASDGPGSALCSPRKPPTCPAPAPALPACLPALQNPGLVTLSQAFGSIKEQVARSLLK